MDRLVLIVEDDRQIATLMERVLTEEGLAVTRAEGPEEARALISEQPPDAAILDLKMPGMDGGAFLRSLRAEGFTAPVLVVSAADDAGQIATDLGVAFLRKPFDIDEFVSAVRGVVGDVP
jgi:DNA-binding response OmpR family regulator